MTVPFSYRQIASPAVLRAWVAGLVIAAQLGAAPLAAAQVPAPGPAATIRGVVKDPSGATLPGVTIDVAGTVNTKRVVTEQDGSFVIRELPPTRYRITAALAGFEPWSRDDVDVESGRVTELNITLRLGISTQPGMAVLQPFEVVVRSADAILHIKIVSTLETTIAGDLFRYPQTEHRAVVLDVIADRDRQARAGGEVRLLQPYAGTVTSGGRSYTGGLAVHRTGDELVILAERSGDTLIAMSPPIYEFKLESGVVRIRQTYRLGSFADGMTVAAFSDTARALIAKSGPLRFGPTAAHLRSWAIWELHLALGANAKPWLFNAFGQGYLLEPKWYVDAYLEPDRVAPRLRVGQMATMIAALTAVGAYDGVRRWSRSRTDRWAQVLVATGADPLAIKDQRDLARPFRVLGEIADDALVAVVDFIRSSPENPTPQPPKTAAIFTRVEGTWPIQRLEVEGGAISVVLIGPSPDEKSGQAVVVRRVGSGWTITRITGWIAD